MRQISEIDQDIDTLMKSLCAMAHLGPKRQLSPAHWQRAWDKNPTLSAYRDQLYLERGNAQKERDEMEHKAWMSQRRSKRAA